MSPRSSRASALGLGVSLIGVVLVISGGDLGALLGGEGDRTGEILMIAAVLSWTAFTVFGRTLRTPPVAASATQALVASLLLLPFIAAGLPQLTLDGGGWLAVVYIALFPSIGSFLLWAMSVKRLGAGTAGVYLNLLPIFTAVLGVLLGVPLSAAQIAGGVLVMVGVTLTSRAGRAGSRAAPVGVAGPVR